MSGDYAGGGGFGNRGGFPNQMMPMNNMGMNNQGQMMGYSQQQQIMMPNQMVGNVPDGSMMGTNPVGMHVPNQMMQQQQQQQQQMRQQQSMMSNLQQNMNPVNNNSGMLQTPTVPNAPMLEQQQPPTVSAAQNPQAPQQLGQSIYNTPQFTPMILAKFGQETVQEIVCRFQDMFQTLRLSTPPNGSNQAMEKKVQEQLRTIRLLFKRIRLLYDRCNEGAQASMEYTTVQSLIPMKDELGNRPEPPHTEEYKKAAKENRELLDTLMVKNKQLREVIERLRIMIWEINTMLSMRRS